MSTLAICLNPSGAAFDSFTALRRWIVVAAATLGMAGGYGAITTVSLLMAPFQTEFGWNRGSISLAYVLLAGGAALGGLAAGRLADSLPSGLIAMAGAATVGLGLFGIAYQDSLSGIWLIYALIGLLGFSALYAPLLTSVGLWFDKKRGLALGIVTAGAAIGQGLMPQLFEQLCTSMGWRGAMATLGLGYLVLLVPAMALVSKPDSIRRASTGRAGATWPISPAISLVLIGAAAVFCCTLMAVPTTHLVSFARERGLSSETAASLLTTLMLSGVTGRILAGVIADRIGSLRTYALVSAIQTASVYFFFAAPDLATLYLVAIVFGFGFAGVMTALVCCVRDAFPPDRLGSANSVISLLAWSGMALGGFQGGICADLTGSYQLSFANAVLAGCANLALLALLALLLRRAQVNAPNVVQTASHTLPTTPIPQKTALARG